MKRLTGHMGRLFALGVFALLLAACARGEPPSGIQDPYEERNRAVHEANLAVDRAFLRGAGEGVARLPKPLRTGLSNFSSNFSLPQTVVNDLLQLRIEDALHNTFRLAVNTTVGLGGLLDPATEMGIEERPSDFGETLYVWGVPEGNYVVHPIIGPSTERRTVGMVVDLFTDPLGYLLPSPERHAGKLAAAVAAVGSRGDYGSEVEAILYESADSYAQARLIYLENRRHLLGSGATAEDSYFDPYEDLYVE